MKVQEQDIYHGPALMQIVEHDSFKALNKADDRYGHYLVNKDICLWFKYASSKDGPWSFTFSASDLVQVKKELGGKGKTFFVFACGHVSVCCLSEEELKKVVDLSSAKAQWVRIEAPENKQMRVTGSSCADNPLKVAHNSFPGCIFK